LECLPEVGIPANAGAPVIDKEVSMRKFARIVQGKVDNIYETNNDITQEFPAGEFWIEVPQGALIDYDFNAINTDGVWAFNSGFPWPQTALADKIRYEKSSRLDKVNARLASTALQYKVDLGIATPADEAYLLAHKQFCIAMTEVNKQPGFPTTINWPELP
jgi:Caudovirales tail fibre assembly protein, lambda gpK